MLRPAYECAFKSICENNLNDLLSLINLECGDFERVENIIINYDCHLQAWLGTIYGIIK
jgi:hypothetical protein